MREKRRPAADRWGKQKSRVSNKEKRKRKEKAFNQQLLIRLELFFR